ncbi:MAG: cytochrome c [Candidatus Competibacterales bacterium]|nr:cytochrome c [Candidatus Competibacterales bacterium]
MRLLPALAGLLGFSLPAWAEPDVEHGRYLLHAGGCVTCHTREDAPEGAFLAGGRALETPFGTFYTPNITPDPETGIGTWSDADFIRAFREGLSPEGDHYYPAFPYPSYTGITDSDLLDLKAYLFSLEPVRSPRRAHDLSWYTFRFTLGGWKWLHFEPGPYRPDPGRDEQWNRGAYLVRHLGHCGECHTPRTWTGGLDREHDLAGNPEGPEGGRVPNLTPHESGLDGWSVDDITLVLELGMLPDGDFVGGSMSEVVDDNTSQLTPADREAIAVYLRSLPPRPDPEE